MKRFVLLVMVAVMLFGIVGCNDSTNSEVKLKKRNVEDYLTLETTDYEIYNERVGDLAFYSNFFKIGVSVKSKVDANYTDAKLTLRVVVHSNKSTFYKEQPYELSEKGEYSGEVIIQLQNGGLEEVGPIQYSVVIKKVEGTVKTK